MAKLHPVDPELIRKAGLKKPTPPEELQLQNLPAEKEQYPEPDWEEMLRYWNEVPE